MKELFTRYPNLKGLEKDINNALEIMINCYNNGGKFMLVGNGGSAADCAHMAGELLKDFAVKRPIDEDFYYKLSSISESARQTASKLQKGIPCVDLTAFNSAITAMGNDTGYEFSLAQIFYSLCKPNDILVAFTTSGTSKNIVKTLEVAKALNVKTITFTGENGLKDDSLSTVTLKAPEHETYKAQELHLPIYHYLCKRLEEVLFKV